MKTTSLFSIAALCTLLVTGAGCRTCHEAETLPERRDSVRTVIRTRTTYVDDTVHVSIPESEVTRVVRDTVSVIENRWSVCRASLSADGTLTHRMRTKPGMAAIPVRIPAVSHDTTVTATDSVYVIKKVPVTRTEYGERPLKKWQLVGIWGFYGLAAAVAIWAAARFVPWRRVLKLPWKSLK